MINNKHGKALIIKMKKTRLVSVFLISLLLIALIAACGGNPLEKIVSEAQNEIGPIQDMLGDEMTIEISARGESTLVYTFTFLIDLDDPAALRSHLQAELEAQNAIYESLLVDLRNARVPSPEVVVEYLESDGTVIYSKTYR